MSGIIAITAKTIGSVVLLFIGVGLLLLVRRGMARIDSNNYQPWLGSVMRLSTLWVGAVAIFFILSSIFVWFDLRVAVLALLVPNSITMLFSAYANWLQNKRIRTARKAKGNEPLNGVGVSEQVPRPKIIKF